MNQVFDAETRYAVRSALARQAYDRDTVQMANPDVAGFRWLVASHRGVFAVSETQTSKVLHGWYFGIERVEDHVYLFENCGLRDRTTDVGRVIRFRIVDGRLGQPTVLVKGLHNNCHQIRIIDGYLCLVDSANQAIRRYLPDGKLVDVRTPFPVAPPSDKSGLYLHINSIAQIDDRIAIMCHNGAAKPARPSQIAWFDKAWNLLATVPVAGHRCHDIVRDHQGRIWHCASAEGEIINSDGLRLRLSDESMTRALGFAGDYLIVGLTPFGPRQMRDTFNGRVVILGKDYTQVSAYDLSGSPNDLTIL